MCPALLTSLARASIWLGQNPTLSFKGVPGYAFKASKTGEKSIDENLWILAINMIDRQKSYFIDNEPEASWLTIANKLLK